jgi:hypothetical protein
MGHAYLMMKGKNPLTRKSRELDGSAGENQYRYSLGGTTTQRKVYGANDPKMKWALPQYNNGEFKIYGTDKNYKLRK